MYLSLERKISASAPASGEPAKIWGGGDLPFLLNWRKKSARIDHYGLNLRQRRDFAEATILVGR